MRASNALTCALLLLVPAATVADDYVVPAGEPEDLAALTDRACAAPASPECEAALGLLTARAIAALAILSDRREPQAAELARLAVDSASADLRAVAAEALAVPFAAPQDTPLLAELADDPVPAVRAAALRSLRSSADPRAQLIARRADAGGSEADEDPASEPDAEVPTSAAGVPLPADAVYLFFASDPAQGVLSYSTAQAPAQVVAALAKKGRGPFTPEQFRQEVEGGNEEMEEEMELEDGEMPSPEQMAKMMQMAEKMMAEMNKNPNATPEQQAMAMARASGAVLLDANLADDYEDAEIFGDPKIFIVQLPDGSDGAVAVYQDRAVGRTGITVHGKPSPGG
ncbi:MAG TPA: HEAT repeat domain-containing protein [Thermoanaerobaculia bacterium]|nr:HEAT repeat domain-containing protein [Thermoanaerobaculia bacterium]